MPSTSETRGRFSCPTEGGTGETSDCVIIHQMHKDIYEKMLFKKGRADDKVTSLFTLFGYCRIQKGFFIFMSNIA